MDKLANILADSVAEKVTEKLAGRQLFTHATSANNLRKILDMGELMPLKELAKKMPNTAVNVENALTSLTGRNTMSAQAAAAAMDGIKEIDKVFLTKGGYLPHYGENIISRMAYSPKRRLALNLAPGEHTVTKGIPIKDKYTRIYVPDELLDTWRSEYPGVSFFPKSEFEGAVFNRVDGALDLPAKGLGAATSALNEVKQRVIGKDLDRDALAEIGLGEELKYLLGDDASYSKDILRNTGELLNNLNEVWKNVDTAKINAIGVNNIPKLSEKEIKSIFGHNASLVGSEALGTAATNAASDIDIALPFNSKFFYDRALKKLKKQFPDMVASPFNKGKTDKGVYTINVGGTPIDLALSLGPRGMKFRDGFNQVKSKLTQEQRAAIINEKNRLLSSWLLPRTRYKAYKRKLADELGLKDLYF
jgi:hypothetical protein